MTNINVGFGICRTGEVWRSLVQAEREGIESNAVCECNGGHLSRMDAEECMEEWAAQLIARWREENKLVALFPKGAMN